MQDFVSKQENCVRLNSYQLKLSKSRSTMNVDLLISAIQKRPAVWDKQHREHASRVIVDKMWKEISAELDFDEAALRKKWKSLRDYFAIEYNKRCSSKSGDGADKQIHCSWQYFQQMLFLRDNAAPKASPGSSENLIDEHQPRFTVNLDLNDSCTDSLAASQAPHDHRYSASNDPMKLDPLTDPEICSTSSQMSFVTESASQRKRRQWEARKYKKDPNHTQEHRSKRQVVYLTNKRKKNDTSDDADMLFLKSLHPYMKELPPHLRLSFRNRVQLALEELAFPASTESPISK